jgi:N-acetylmuramoyl-L-alanine amidase
MLMIFRLRFFAIILTAVLFNSSCSSARNHDATQSASPIQQAQTELAAAPMTYPANPLVIIDAGHGGSDEGARVHTFLEKRVTLKTALLTKKRLEERGYKVILTRSRDIYLSLPRRVSIANKMKGAIFVSLHFNASRNPIAKGVEVYYCGNKEKWRARASRRLADYILYQLVDQTEAVSRGIKGGNFHVIRETEMPAVLVEGGFVTNEEERGLLKTKNYLDKIAEGIALGVDKYFKS